MAGAFESYSDDATVPKNLRTGSWGRMLLGRNRRHSLRNRPSVRRSLGWDQTRLAALNTWMERARGICSSKFAQIVRMAHGVTVYEEIF